jgi:hypothetical protein
MYYFIKSFVTNRSIVTKIGNDFSNEYPTFGGTPQGSVISPILFLIMINDFPIGHDQKISISLFADDSAIWMTGRNYKIITNSLQRHLEMIVKWCNKWGFSINSAKTNSITFTRRRYEHIPLKINSQVIVDRKEVKFLGLIFDSRLNWEKHIDYIDKKCKPRLHLLRSLNASGFGSNKKTLLLIYRALIRSVIDYGIELYHTASVKSFNKLNSIQYQSLKIICGATNSASLSSLQNECGELPNCLKQEETMLKHAVKIISKPNNITNGVLKKYPMMRNPNKLRKFQPVFKQIEPIKPLLEKFTKPYQPHPPWYNEHKLLRVDTTLTGLINKDSHNSVVHKSTVLQYLQNYSMRIPIYTDGSKLPSGNSGASRLL